MHEVMLPSRSQLALPGIVKHGTLPAKIGAALHESLAAFASQRNVSDADRAANLKSYVTAMEGFHEALILEVLRFMTLNNPRNPFPYTAQDLHERLNSRAETWSRLVCRGIFEADWDVEQYGPGPLRHGCFIPDDLTRQYLKKALRAHQVRMSSLANLLPADFAIIPEDVFPATGDYCLEEVRKARADAEKERAFQAYLESLPADQRWIRRQIIAEDLRVGIKRTEPDLMALVHERMKGEAA